MIGQTISHYKILEKIGEGGMGVVYKAHDTKLDRDVALKFLPRDLSPSEEERTRFIHEAKAASALDHPNICTIYEIDETPDGQMFIVMGCYEGASLSRKVEKGRLDVAEAVQIAIQIAEGLQAAHEKEIIHRDIKSSNIIVSDKGQVRILDFGLAYKRGLSKLTKTGSTVGTAAYMSPEQARGEKLDHRTDLWSLGVVLYEMVTGHLPFRGEHEAAILYSVVNEEPQPIQDSVLGASPELIHIVRRALEKDRGERYRSAEDMLIDLRRLKKDTSRVGFLPVSGSRKIFSSRKNEILISAGVLLLLCVGGYLFLFKRGVEINPYFTQRTIEIPLKHVSAPGISPDGKYLVFPVSYGGRNENLFVVSVTGGEPRQLTIDTFTVGWPIISPDGKTIVCGGDYPSYEIDVLPYIGGTRIRIGNGITPKWSPDGKRIGYIELKGGNLEFWSMNSEGRDNRLHFIDTFAFANRLGVPNAFAWSPDGRSVAMVRPTAQTVCEIVLHDLVTHKEIKLVTDTTWKNEVCWGNNNQIVYSAKKFEGWNLWTVPASGGDPVQITKGSRWEDMPTISSDCKTIAYLQIEQVGHLKITRLDGSYSQFEVASSDNLLYDWAAISPDGKYITFSGRSPTRDVSHIYLIDRNGSNQRQLTFSETYDNIPMFSPDSRSIVYNSGNMSDPPESVKVCVVNIERNESPRVIARGVESGWKDSATIEVRHHNKCWRIYLDGRPEEQLSGDSIYAISVLDGHYILFMDQHQPSDGLWRVCKIEDWDGTGAAKSWTVWKGATFGISRNDGIFALNSSRELLRISFRDGKQEKLPVIVKGSGMQLDNFRIRVTRDGREMAFPTIEMRGKLGVIENLFR
jgi:serine/threonine protein kinase